MATRKSDTGGGAQKSTGAGDGAGAAKKAPAQKTTAAPKGATASKGAAAKGAAKGAGATKAAGTKAAGATKAAGTKAAGATKRAAPRTKQPDLRADARGFVAGRPQGWNHDEWLGFLDDLRSRGHNVEDKEAIGNLLERERLAHALEKVPGIGAQRVRAIAERYGNIWRLKETSADDLARDANVPRPLAERIVESVR